MRADVDHFLVREAIALGVEYVDQTTLDGLEWQPNGDAIVAGSRDARPLRFRSRLIVDASGPHGFSRPDDGTRRAGLS
jgi:flavin-dependent dehydrogenase